MTKTSFHIIISGFVLALVVAVFIPMHSVMAGFNINASGSLNLGKGITIGYSTGSGGQGGGGSLPGASGSVSDLGSTIIYLINSVFVPVIFALAFIVFIWGIFRYFIAGATDPTEQEKGKHLIIYGLIGFVVMLSVWGLVNILTNTFGLYGTNAPSYPTLPTNH